ncbi:DUF4190 domain-containing protein [Gordonia alkanivorans]|uniref:DUF4190 domain-containing protein n=1 Tax=Gordonia alkanivorans TaxID=84096 RepID=UPI0024493607|nr:DUF4190 domain-containing protein [Gordonia alkanivorans]MDH3019497.1 DUF4190 domain-containing protein [Gordonia alkanivorans]MDH3045964.1 DUF4190 domain-containing protein [Gordonia alkanivorans]
MRVDIPTQPFSPAITERHERWPAVNDLDDNSLPALSHTAVEAAPPAEHQTSGPSPRPATRVDTRLRPAPEDHAALPPVGDFWGLQNSVEQSPVLPFVTSRPTPIVRPLPYSPPAVRRTVAPAASLALTTGLIAIPMTLVLGLGAILGMVAIVSGIVGIKQVNRAPANRKGTGRAVTGIVCGVGSVVVGGPILLLLALVFGL